MYSTQLIFPVLEAISLAAIGYFLVFAASYKVGLLRHVGNALGAIDCVLLIVIEVTVEGLIQLLKEPGATTE